MSFVWKIWSAPWDLLALIILIPGGAGRDSRPVVPTARQDHGHPLHAFAAQVRQGNHRAVWPTHAAGRLASSAISGGDAERAVFNELTVYENVDYFCSLYVPQERCASLWWAGYRLVGLQDFRRFFPRNFGGLLRRLNIKLRRCPSAQIRSSWTNPPSRSIPRAATTSSRAFASSTGRGHCGLHLPLYGGGRAALYPDRHHG